LLVEAMPLEVQLHQSFSARPITAIPTRIRRMTF